MDKTQKTVDKMFHGFQQKFTDWLKDKPTGKFSIEIPVNEGGVRGKPETVIREKM